MVMGQISPHPTKKKKSGNNGGGEKYLKYLCLN